MKNLHLSAAALKALEAFNNLRPAAASGYNVRTSSGLAAACTTFTGAFRAIRRLPQGEQNNAYIYDDDGNCLYR